MNDVSTQAVARRLSQLLLLPIYRRRWERYATHARRDLNYEAIATVIRAYLIDDVGEISENSSRRSQRARVRRALTGERISVQTREHFIQAFGMTAAHAAELRALHTASDPWAIRLMDVGQVNSEPRGVPSRDFETIRLDDIHILGSDGIPLYHRTRHFIRAINTIQCYPYTFDTDTATVEVLRGGHASPLYEVGDGLFAVDIELHEPLFPGQAARLEYITHFGYKVAPDPIFRRAARKLLTDLTIEVRFHPARLPRRITWAAWINYYENDPVAEEEVALDKDGSVVRRVERLENQTVGFRWEW